MPLEKAPAVQAPWPPDPAKDSQGRSWEPRPVGKDQKESFYSIAAEKQLNPLDLVEYNFRTRNPQEINWYLRQYVGCFNATRDGLNYTFFDAGKKPSVGDPAKTKGVIYIPVAARKLIVLDPITLTGPIPPEEKERIFQGSVTFNGELPPRPFTSAFVVGTLGVSWNGKYAFLESANEVQVSFGKEDIGAALSRKLTEDTSLQIGSKLKFEDIIKNAKSPKELLTGVAKNMEVAVSTNLFKPSQNTIVSLGGGAQLSATPIFVELKGQCEGKIDLGPHLGSRKPVLLAISVELTVRVNLGPSPTLLARLGLTAGADLIAAGGGLILLLPAFVLLGAWDYGRRIENARKIGLLSWYVTGYVGTLFGGFGSLPPGQDMVEETKLHTAGRGDAEADANRMFSGLQGGSPMALYLTALLMLTADKPPRERVERARNILRSMLWHRLAEKNPGLDPPM